MARAHTAGARIALDTSGPALREALRERPDVVKPNAEELAETVGRPLATVGDAVKAAEELRELGAGAVLASLGADGQLLVSADGVWFGSAAWTSYAATSAQVTRPCRFPDRRRQRPEGTGLRRRPRCRRGPAAGSVMPTPADLDPSAVTVTSEVPADRVLTEPAS